MSLSYLTFWRCYVTLHKRQLVHVQELKEYSRSKLEDVKLEANESDIHRWRALLTVSPVASSRPDFKLNFHATSVSDMITILDCRVQQTRHTREVSLSWI